MIPLFETGRSGPRVKSRRRIAALPMYDLPELAAANDALWAAVAERLKAAGVEGAPRLLSRDLSLDAVWSDPDLLLAQTCGYPLVTRLDGRVQLVATPAYRAAGCAGPFHRSAIVVRADHRVESLTDLRGQRCAVNDHGSNTGMNLLRTEIAPLANGLPFFGAVIVTGAHAASAEAVADGVADVAAIDAVTFAHLQRHRPRITARLKVLAWSQRSPGLPLITAADTTPETLGRLRDALDDVARDPALKAVRAALLLDGFHVLRKSEYRAILYLQQIAEDQAYPALR